MSKLFYIPAFLVIYFLAELLTDFSKTIYED